MAVEIEHKYLIDLALWQPKDAGVLFRQGYLTTGGRVVRVRIAGDQGILTIKGPAKGLSRLEFEYAIPLADAAEMLDALAQQPLIEKTRYTEIIDGKAWEIDVFHGDNDGLVIAEIEVAAEDETVVLPPWIVTEVSHDQRYFNSNLIANPYRNWRES
jgi:adenylate cyclase